MADSGGHWQNLAEAQQLTQETLVPGVVQEIVRRGGMLPLLPIMQVAGQSVKWNLQENERTARRATIGSTLTWTDNITYAQRERELKILYDQTPLNHFVESVYGNINNYEAITLMDMRMGMINSLEDALIYDDLTFGTNQFDGLHAWAQDGAANGPLDSDDDISIDEGEGALAIINMRTLEDSMKHGFDYWAMPDVLHRRLAAFYQEAGIGGSPGQQLGVFNFSIDQAGQRVSMFNGKPILVSDYMVGEEANTGVGSDARAKNTSGTVQYSIFAIKRGQVAQNNPGMTLAFGGDTNGLGEFFKFIRFENLEDFDAAGLRMVSYVALLAGSFKSVGRIFDITDAAITL